MIRGEFYQRADVLHSKTGVLLTPKKNLRVIMADIAKYSKQKRMSYGLQVKEPMFMTTIQKTDLL